MTEPVSLRSVTAFAVSDRAVAALGLALGLLAQARGVRFGLAESCTGGLASAWVTAQPGSSQWFEGGVVSYSNAMKAGLLGVSDAMLAAHGAVSRPVAQAMASGLTQCLRAANPLTDPPQNWASAAITGIAGPGGGSLEKPVGLVWFAWQYPDTSQRQEACVFTGGRQAIQRQAAWWALQGLVAGLARPNA